MSFLKLRSILLVCLLLPFLTSCHSDYISLDYKIHHSAVWNNNHTQVALILRTEAFRQAGGIARFPDGGIAKTVFTETALYLFQPETKTIYKAARLESFPLLWDIKIAFSDSLVYYCVSPPTDWDQQLENAKTEADSLRVSNMKKTYFDPFVYNDRTKKISHVDASIFSEMYSEKDLAELQSLYNQIKEVPLADLGLVLQKIYPKADREYINDFIYSAKGGSPLTKRAIAEQIISPLSKSEIRNILKMIDDYKESLDGFEKQSFELYSEDKIELLKKLL